MHFLSLLLFSSCTYILTSQLEYLLLSFLKTTSQRKRESGRASVFVCGSAGKRSESEEEVTEKLGKEFRMKSWLALPYPNIFETTLQCVCACGKLWIKCGKGGSLTKWRLLYKWMSCLHTYFHFSFLSKNVSTLNCFTPLHWLDYTLHSSVNNTSRKSFFQCALLKLYVKWKETLCF